MVSPHRHDGIADLIDAVMANGTRAEIVAIIALLVARIFLLKDRARELRRTPTLRTLTVTQAVATYPVSRSLLYERGEALGVAHRVDGTRKLMVDEAALRAWLTGQRRG